MTVVGQVTPLGALSVRLVKSQGPRAGAGPALVVTREPKEQTTPFPGQSASGGVLQRLDLRAWDNGWANGQKDNV